MNSTKIVYTYHNMFTSLGQMNIVSWCDQTVVKAKVGDVKYGLALEYFCS